VDKECCVKFNGGIFNCFGEFVYEQGSQRINQQMSDVYYEFDLLSARMIEVSRNLRVIDFVEYLN